MSNPPDTNPDTNPPDTNPPDTNPSDPLLLSLRHWPSPAPEETSLPHLVHRIHTQRYFNGLTEDTLQAEINASASNDTSDALHDARPTTIPEPPHMVVAKSRMIDYIFHAHNEAMIALDFISLVCSLQAPEIATSSMSPMLKASVPVGCLGHSRLVRKVDKAEVEKEEKIAKEWKQQGLVSAADLLLGASKRLGEEVNRERRYWREVLEIREGGWLVTRMPREKNGLGVRYGFAEATLSGIAPLRRGEDGGVRMEEVESGGRMVRVRIMRGGEVTGESWQRVGREGEGVMKSVRKARNSIYEEELFAEVMKEARMYAGMGMKTREDEATVEVGGVSVVVDMAPIDDPNHSLPLMTPDTQLANYIALSLRILLSYNHRLSLSRRSRPPPPMTPHKPTPEPMRLLRPITTYLLHTSHQTHLSTLLRRLCLITTTAGLSSSFTLTPFSNTVGRPITSVETAIDLFIHMLETTASVSLPGGWSLTITMRTALQRPIQGTQYVITTHHDGVSIRQMGEQRFSSEEEAGNYVWWCLERAVVNHIRLMGEWVQEGLGNEMVCKKGRIRVEVQEGVGLVLVWGKQGGRDRKEVWDGTERGRSLAEVLEGIV